MHVNDIPTKSAFFSYFFFFLFGFLQIKISSSFEIKLIVKRGEADIRELWTFTESISFVINY